MGEGGVLTRVGTFVSPISSTECAAAAAGMTPLQKYPQERDKGSEKGDTHR